MLIETLVIRADGTETLEMREYPDPIEEKKPETDGETPEPGSENEEAPEDGSGGETGE